MSDQIHYVDAGQLLVKGRRDDGTLDFVTSKAAGPDLDVDQQICDPNWLAEAMPQWFETGGNLREMHQPIAAGIATELSQKGDSFFVAGHVVDPGSVAKVEQGVLQGLSIGIKGPRVKMGTGNPPGGTICGGRIVEVSLVDRAANPSCKLTLAKTAQMGEFYNGEKTETPVTPETVVQVEELVEKRDVSTAERQRLAKTGKAMPGGGYPISNVGDLKNAIQAVGRAKDPAKTKAHIKSRAKALGRTDLIPETWKLAQVGPAGQFKADDDTWTHDPTQLAAVRDGLVALMKTELDELQSGEPELGDVSDLFTSLSMFLSWWGAEASEGEVTSPYSDDTSQEDQSPMYASLGVNPELVKAGTAEDATDEKRQELADEARAKLDAVVAEAVKSAAADAVKDAIDEVTKAGESKDERIKALEDELAEVKKMAAPGAPARVRPPEAAKAAAEEHKRAEADRLRRLSNSVTDRELSRGYAQKAAELEASITA